MKKAFKNTTVFLLLFTVMIGNVGCKVEVNTDKGSADSGKSTRVKSQKVAEYPKSNAPIKIINADNYWYSLIGSYGNDDYKLTVSENPEDLNVVYEINDAAIWDFEANSDYIVWSEIKENENRVMLYKNSDGKVTDIYTADTTDEVHIANVGLYKDCLYYIETDYKNCIDSIIEYDVKNDTTEIIYTTKCAENNSIMNLSVKENYLTAATRDDNKIEMILFDLNSDNKPVITELPDNTEYVYDVAYDNINDTYAIYYADKDKKEQMGIYNKKMKDIKNIVTFNENVYAYQDNVECYDGNVYWIYQANVSGNVTDHYILEDYDYIKDRPKQYERTFYFTRVNGSLYRLSFDKDGEYKNIVLNKHEINS